MTAEGLVPHYARVGADPVRDAFAARRAVMPWRSRRPLPAGEVEATWARLLADRRAAGPRLAYVHVPFCANHCLFCGFYRNAYTPQAATAYTDLVIAEIEREADAPAVAAQPVEAVYLGGGTPSALSAAELSRLVAAIRRSLPLAPGCEITIEGRIIHFDAEKVDACLEAGANRISIGVQSFDTAVRRRQGRRAGKEEAIAFIEALRDRDRAAVVIDLLFGLPGQTEAVWREDLAIAADIAPDGVDLYGLNLIPGTPLHRAAAAGKFPDAPTLADLGGMYRAGSDFLAGRGWRQISNSHWGRTPRERNVYNLRIKEGAECLAYGSGGGGLIGGHSYAVAPDLQTYADGVRAGRKPIEGMRVSDTLQPLRNAVTAGIEVGALDVGALAALAPGADVAGALAPLLRQWQSAGLVALDGDVVRLTTAGRFWYSNLVFAFDAILCAGAAAPDAPRARPDLPSDPRKTRELS
ncbi:MAG: heme anaerobic degradation radical SAM methyltransferase ChuW/HutW [Hyphomicrobiales bacterium]|nr:MAG: heme anaerobic degradation radical SAM methyltransferase ChuW/HutW [Hyphomicrobiales bacterium]